MKRSKSTLSISTELKAFLESGVSVVVGTRDAALSPEVTRAWGLLVSKDRKTIGICVPLATSRKTLNNLTKNGQMTVCCCLPTSYRTVQLKGKCVKTADPNRAELAGVAKHREAFGRQNERLGLPLQLTETFWRMELKGSAALVKLRFVPEQIFDQTPGPDAGSPL